MTNFSKKENIVLPNIKNFDKFQKTLDNLLHSSPITKSKLAKYHREAPSTKGTKSTNQAS